METNPPPLTSTPSSGSPTRTRPFYPTERDRQIISAVYTHRALTSDQLSILFWGVGKPTTRCKNRLRLLVEHGYLERAEQAVTLAEGRRPLVYFLDRAGVEVAADTLGVEPSQVDWKKSYNSVKWQFLDHLLATNHVRVRVEYTAPRVGLTLTEWQDDKTLSTYKEPFAAMDEHGVTRKILPPSPDGYFGLKAHDRPVLFRAFLEADRGTVPLTRWASKVSLYRDYFRSPEFAQRFHARTAFRVLAVTTTPDRLANMKAVTEEAGGKSLFWFTTYGAITRPTAVLFTPVWYMAGSSEPVCFPYPPPAASEEA